MPERRHGRAPVGTKVRMQAPNESSIKFPDSFIDRDGFLFGYDVLRLF
jgi:hypothetical protein